MTIIELLLYTVTTCGFAVMFTDIVEYVHCDVFEWEEE